MFSIQSFLTCQSKLPMNYKPLSQIERNYFYALFTAGHDQTQISKLLNRHISTINRELSPNRGPKGYRPNRACATETKRSEKSRNAATMPPWVAEQAACLLKMHCSPEQIAGKLPVSHRRFTSMFTLARLEAARSGRTFAARSKKERVTQAVGTGGARSRTDAP
jgi:IS30 family transposase